MMPGLGGMNPAQMSRMMKSLGIKTEELQAKKVVIETSDKTIVINNPQINVIDMKGQKTFTINGEVSEEGSSSEDVELVMEKANVSKEEAEKALEKSNGDIAEAIAELTS